MKTYEQLREEGKLFLTDTHLQTAKDAEVELHKQTIRMANESIIALETHVKELVCAPLDLTNNTLNDYVWTKEDMDDALKQLDEDGWGFTW